MLPALLPLGVYILTPDYIFIITFSWFNFKPMYHSEGIIQNIVSLSYR